MINADINVKPYGGWNSLFNFDSNYNTQLLDESSHYIAKLFQIAMIYTYKKLGMDALVKEMVLIDAADSEPGLLEHVDIIMANGVSIQNYVTKYGWEMDDLIIDSADMVNLSEEEKKTYINSILTTDEIDLMSGIIYELMDNDSTDSSFGLSMYISKKVGKYFYYIKNHPNLEYDNDATIILLVNQLHWPFINEGYSAGGLIGDTYYIGFIEGYKDGYFDFGPESMDVYFPLYAHYLNSFIDQAYKDLDIEDYCTLHPVGGDC